MTTQFAVGAIAFLIIVLSPPGSAFQDPQACITGATCECVVGATDVSANAFEKCPCQRGTYCLTGTVPSDCCTLDENDEETPCVVIVSEEPHLQAGCCKPKSDPVCEIKMGCAVKMNITVTISECCSATSNPGGVGVTGSIDCSAIKCCTGDSYTVSSGGSSNGWSGLGETTLFQVASYMPCGREAGPTVFGRVSCTGGGSEYGDVAHISVSGFVCKQCPKIPQ